MSFMDKVKSGFDKAKDGISDLAETTKIKLEISKLESRKSSLLGEIGKQVFALHKQGREMSDVEGLCKEIDGLEEQIAKKGEEITRINTEARA
jgi:hypothetical protein